MGSGPSLATERTSRAWVHTLAALVLALAPSCSARLTREESLALRRLDTKATNVVPEITAPAPQPARAKPAVPEVEPRFKGDGLDELHFNLTSTSHTSFPTADEKRAEEARATTFPAARDLTDEARSEPQVPRERLIEDLGSRLEVEWASLSGGVGRRGPDDIEARRRTASVELIAFSFLRAEGNGESEKMLGEAAALVSSADSNDLERLLLAAYLVRKGEEETARRILAGVLREDGSTPPSVTEPGAPFALEGLAFARSIRGPRNYVPLEKAGLMPSKKVLIYGEFQNFKTKRGDTKAKEGPTYMRAFSASLRLVAADGTERDRLDFLPPALGRSESSSEDEIMNFWAEYRIPADLEPGRYRIIVDGKDVVGEALASAHLELDVEPREAERR